MSGDMRGSALVAQEINRLGLGQYIPILFENGFDSWPALYGITQEDLDQLGFDPQSQHVLKRFIMESQVGDSDVSLYDDHHFSHPDQLGAVEEQQSSSSKARHSKAGIGGKRRYRRHPKPDVNAPKRPLTAYASFANHVRTDPAVAALSFVQIAREVGKRWQNLPQEERNIWEQRAMISLNDHKQQLERYKKTEESRTYQRYLGDFKRQQQATQYIREEDVEHDYELPETSQQEYRVSTVYDATSTASSLSATSPSTSETEFPGFLHTHGLQSQHVSGKPMPFDLSSSGSEFSPNTTTQRLHGLSRSDSRQTLFQTMMGPDSSLTRAIIDFRDRCHWLIAQGTPFAAISGPDFIDVTTFFDKTKDPGCRIDAWACCLNRSFTDQDQFVLLACVMFQTHFMRWMIYPSAELYDRIPHMLQLTDLQRNITHPYPIDMIPIPPLRDALIHNLRDWFTALRALSVNWLYGMEACVERHYDGSLRLSARFIDHVSRYENWSATPEFFEAFPELVGRIRLS